MARRCIIIGLLALTTLAPTAQAARHRCGQVLVTQHSPTYWEGQAHHITAKGVSCMIARRLARGCVLGHRSGWRYSQDAPAESGPRSGWGNRIWLEKRGAGLAVTFYIAGGGDCQPRYS